MADAANTLVAPDDRRALEALVVDMEGLANLEGLIAEFNIFEALGAVRQELRHSALLAFLLDPNEGHGLGDGFLRYLLQRTLIGSAGVASLSAIDVDLWELDDVEVRREWKNTDILLLDERNKFVVIIENKVDSSEHSEQLQRYWGLVEKEFPGFRVLGLYLTPECESPSDRRYLPIDYALVADLVGHFLNIRSSTIGPDVRTLLRHYEQMLRRHIVSDTDIAQLCRRIYRKHRRALDLIFEHRPDPVFGAVREAAETLVRGNADLLLDDSSKTYLRFAPREWDTAELKQGTGWTKSRRMLLFEIVFQTERVFVKLTIGPGPADVRTRLFAVAQGSPTLFMASAGTLAGKFHQAFQRVLVNTTTLATEDLSAIEGRLREEWDAFVVDDLPAICAAYSEKPEL